MVYEEEEDFDLAGENPVPTDDEVDDVDEVEENDAEEELDEEETHDDEETSGDESDESEEEEEEEEPKKKDSKTQALDAERARRKQAEKELKELKAKLKAEDDKKTEEDTITKEREDMKKKMLEGDLIDEETADKLLDAFGNDVIKNKLDNQSRLEREKFEEEFSELKKEDLFMDADNYKEQMRDLMKKGLSARQAYMASVSDARFIQMKKDLQVEAEQRLLNSSERANKIDVGVQESKSETKGTVYSKEEQRIAKETGLPVKEVHKRIKMDSIDDFEKL